MSLDFFAISEIAIQTIHAQQNRWSRPVSRVLSWTIIPLGPSSPMGSSNLPVSRAGRAYGHLFGLASSGVCRTGLLPDSWCALTAPFHPCLFPLPRRLRRCRSTLSPLRSTSVLTDIGSSAVCSLLHFPSAHAAQALPGTLPYEARTFLPHARMAAIAQPTPARSLRAQAFELKVIRSPTSKPAPCRTRRCASGPSSRPPNQPLA